MGSELDDDDLNRLAAQVAERLPTGQYGDKVMLTRRQLLGAATGTLGVGALTSLGIGPATAQAAGQVGTQSEPVDVEAASVSADSVSTEKAVVDGRPETTTGIKEVVVPDDYSTIQAAIDNEWARETNHEVYINLQASGSPYNEDVTIAGSVVSGPTDENGPTMGDRQQQLRIRGDLNTPSNVKVDSFYVNAVLGHEVPTIEGVQTQQASPYSGEDAQILFMGCSTGTTKQVEFAGTTSHGVMFYHGMGNARSKADASPGDVTSTVTSKSAIVYANGASGGTSNDYRTVGNGVVFCDASTGAVEFDPTGFIFDKNDNVIHGLEAFPSAFGSTNRRGDDAPIPASGFRMFLRNDLTPREVRGIDQNGFTYAAQRTGESNITDLSGVSGDYGGQLRRDDGTNTTNWGTYCTWRSSDSKWYPHDGSAPF